ncbi:unnamed protein product [Allacma fusca]|uniref:Uncharacterized protein n=1 Tax=Allacma fusca TaxID=39272 RepID=A0A8J2JDV5_9HEXA|nr:unnamed protein product [Allacma fusca]
MSPGAIEQYLMVAPLVRAASPEIEVIFDSSTVETLAMRNPGEVFSTPDNKRSQSPEPEIIFVGTFGGNRSREAPLQVTCRKNLGFKSDPEDNVSILSESSTYSLDSAVPPGNCDQESCVLTPHSVNLLQDIDDTPKYDQPLGSPESADETDEEARPGKKKLKANLVTPAEKKRFIPVEEKENENGLQSFDNFSPQKAVIVDSHPVVVNEKSTNPFITSGEKKRSSVETGKNNDKQPAITTPNGPGQSVSSLNLAPELLQNRTSSPATVECGSPNKTTCIGKLRPISVNASSTHTNGVEELETSAIGSFGSPKRSTNMNLPAADAPSQSQYVSLNSLAGAKIMSHIQGTALTTSIDSQQEVQNISTKTHDCPSRKRSHQSTDLDGPRAAMNRNNENKRKRHGEVVGSKDSIESGTPGKPNKSVEFSEVRVKPVSVEPTEAGKISSPCNGNVASKLPFINCDIRFQQLYKSNPEYATLWEKKRHKEVLLKISKDVQEGRIPSEDYTVEIISTCVLRLTGRISKVVRSLANTLFDQLIQIATLKKYFWSVFDRLNGSLRAQNSGVIDLLLLQMKEESCNSKSEEKLALQFFKSLTVLCQNDYEIYQTQFKLRQPLFVQLMMDPGYDYAADYNENWSNLMKHMGYFRLDTAEVQILIKWVDLLASHYMDAGVKQLIEDGMERLKEDLVANIIKRRDKDYGYKFVLLLQRGQFSLEVSRTLFLDYLPRLEQPVQDWTNILLELCAYIHVPAKPGVSNRPEYGSEFEAFYNFVSSKVNMQGESNVHVVCKGKKCSYGSGSSRQEFDARKLLHLMKAKKIGSINIVDNNGNTPLHEASYHGKTDVVHLIWKLFTEENQPPGPFTVDILAQNEIGQTALHCAVEQRQSDCVAFLVTMAKNCGCQQELVRIRTKAKKTALDLLNQQTDSVSEEIRKLLLDCHTNIRKYFGGVKFSEETISTIESDKKLQAFLFYWRDLYKEMETSRISKLALF